MTKLKLYDFVGDKEAEVEASADLFDVEVKKEVLHLVVKAFLAQRRAGTACAKTRGQVSGGGRKPWKQKGTGRARAGTTTSPLWRGGGVTFGPSPRDYVMKINKKVKRLALKMALSSKKDNTVILKGFKVDSAKTKDAALMLNKINADNAFIVVSDNDVSTERAVKNLPNIKMVKRNQMNVYDILKYKNVCIAEEVLSTLEKELV